MSPHTILRALLIAHDSARAWRDLYRHQGQHDGWPDRDLRAALVLWKRRLAQERRLMERLARRLERPAPPSAQTTRGETPP